MTDVWNNVTIYGPAEEIQRFRRECLDMEVDELREGQLGWTGCTCDISLPKAQESETSWIPRDHYGESVWNFQQFTSDSATEYSFSFDTDGEFPTMIFEALADCFPRLAFDCDCIEAQDEFMGFGWFNPPPGGEPFNQNYQVPGNYWSNGVEKRGPRVAAAHSQRIDEFLATLAPMTIEA